MAERAAKTAQNPNLGGEFTAEANFFKVKRSGRSHKPRGKRTRVGAGTAAPATPQGLIIRGALMA